MNQSDVSATAMGEGLLSVKQWNGMAFDGVWRALHRTVDVVEPATGYILGSIAVASPMDIGEAAARARREQPGWAATNYEERGRILREAARIAELNRDEIANWLVREAGSTHPKAQFEVTGSIKVLYEAAAMTSQSTGHVLPTDVGKISIARRRPIGVVGVISPFNFPLYLAMRAVAPALATGNAVILKPDPKTSVSGGFAIARLFEAAGLPPGVLHVLPGEGDAGNALCTDPNVGMIQFTGSTAAGRKVGEAAGRHLKKVSLELGGKNSLIVLDDADIDLAVKNARWGAYLHQGQICMASGRILVQASIAAEFCARLIEGAKMLPVGDPSTAHVALGPLVSSAQLNHANMIVKSSVDAGATLALGGTAEGLFFSPTVLTGVVKGMAAYDEEIFAPVAVVSTFENDDDAVALANDTKYGLAAGIITNSIGRALAIGERLNVGLLHINDQTVNDDVVNPFGGTGDSGNGSSIGGPANWEEFTQWQWMTVKGAPPSYPL